MVTGPAKRLLQRIIHRFGYEVQMRQDAPYSIFPENEARIATVRHGEEELRFFVANPRDIIQREFMKGRLYEPEERDIIAEHYQSGTTFVDIGANVGNHTIWALTCLGAPRAVAFEPALGAHTLLCANVALNSLADRTVIRKIALSDQVGTARIPYSFVNSDNSGGLRIAGSGRGELVPTAIGDHELDDLGASFVKIDVEGHEIAVLNGLVRTARKQKPKMFVEVEEVNKDAFNAWIERHHYRVVDTYKRYLINCNYLIEPKEQVYPAK